MARRPERICFLVGAPRSGTTWLQRLLQAHPEVCGGEESQFFTLFAHPLRAADAMGAGERRIGPLCYIDREGYEAAIRDLWDRIFADLYAASPGARVHLEKSPFHALCLDEVLRVFPEARIVHLTRDSRAVAASLVHASQSWGRHWAPGSARAAALMWQSHVRAVAEWRSRNPSHPFLQIRYEDALADPAEVLTQVLAFVLPEDAPTLVPETLAAFERQEAPQKDPAGFARHRGRDGWKREMTIYDKLVTWRYTRRTMRELGYAPTIFG